MGEKIKSHRSGEICVVSHNAANLFQLHIIPGNLAASLQCIEFDSVNDGGMESAIIAG